MLKNEITLRGAGSRPAAIITRGGIQHAVGEAPFVITPHRHLDEVGIARGLGTINDAGRCAS